MKPLAVVALALPCALATACVEERGPRDHGGHGGHGGHRGGATLPNDAYYIGVPLPYRTIEDCLADGKAAPLCTYAVALCASGAYGVRRGDELQTGRYHLDDHHAVSSASCHDGAAPDSTDSTPFDFDVEAGQLVGERAAIAWEPDFDGRWKTTAGAVIDCSAPPPRR